MNWINSSDIKNWADTENRLCSENMPLLTRYLINETGGNNLTRVLFPSGDAVLHEGPDGFVESKENTTHIPIGTSIWEFGITKDIKGKANEDYDKDTKNPVGYMLKETTFVFVTPRIWKHTNKEKWIEEKKAEGKWKDVKVYDARDLEEWLEKAPVSSAIFAKKILKKYPNGIQPAEEFLEEFLFTEKISLKDSLILAGREKEKEEVTKWLENLPSKFISKSLTREESLAFLCSCISSLVNEEKNKYLSRCLIVYNVEDFRSIVKEHSDHILIIYFDNFDVADIAVSKKHHVYIPIGPEITTYDPKIELNVLSREGLKKELINIGFEEEAASYYSRESGRSLSVLRRILLEKNNQPEWSKKENIKDIIPALLAGRWDETKKWDEEFKEQIESEDKNIISELANIPYDEYIEKLNIYKNLNDSPVYQIGNKWRLVSPYDAWTILENYLTSAHLDKFEKIVYKVIGEFDPEFNLDEDDRYRASTMGKVRIYSGWLREGLLQTLILASVYGNNKEVRVNKIVNTLLSNADEKKWFSLANLLPQLSEASPEVFLDNVESSLNSKEKSILILFREGENVMFSRCNHAGLLWALEGLAWFPEYLPRVILILGKLSEFDPGGKWANRPIKALRSIFLAWYPNTIATFQQRIDALDLLINNDSKIKIDTEKSVSFNLLLDLLPKTHDIGEPIYKPRWRGFSKLKVENLTYGDIFKTYSEILERLLRLADNNGILLSKIFSSYDEFENLQDREKIYSHIEKALDTMTIGKKELWDSLRGKISWHKTNQDTDWAMSLEVITRLEELYNKIKFENTESSYNWLFDDYYPNIMEGNRRKHEEFEKKVDEFRINAVQDIYSKNGLKGFLELAEKVKFPHLLGDALAKSNLIKYNEEQTLMDLFDKNENIINFSKGYTYHKMRKDGEKWIENIINYFKTKNVRKEIIINFLTTLDLNDFTWKIVESFDEKIKSGYWSKCNGLYGDEYSKEIKDYYYGNMIKYKRFVTALDTASMYPKNISSEIIVELLEKAASTTAIEPFKTQISPYHIVDLFKILDERNDFKDSLRLYYLEWYYVDILIDNIFSNSLNRRMPKLIFKDLSDHPESFIEIIKMYAKPKDDVEMMNKEIGGLTEEQIENRFHKAFEILNSFDIIPGIDESGKIDYNKLINWVKKVIKLGNELKREYYSKYFIGQLFANSIEQDSLPPDEICQVFEEINDGDLEQGFKIGSYNKRGVRSKGIFTGGIEERELAKHFLKLSKEIEYKYPRVSKMYKDRSKNYEYEAKREDERATEEELEV